MGGRSIIIHSLAHARAALAAAAATGRPVTVRSAPGAAAYAGAAWFLEVIAQARAQVIAEVIAQARAEVRIEVPEVPGAPEVPGPRITAVLDCGDQPGLALGALRQGCGAIRFTGPARVTAKIAAIAAQTGAVLDKGSGPALDLLDVADPLTACRDWLEKEPRR